MVIYNKKLTPILLSAIIASNTVFAATYTSNLPTNEVVNYTNSATFANAINPAIINGSGVDYDRGFIYATGTGIIDYSGAIGSLDFAREAAIIDAQRNLAGAANGARIDSVSTVEMKRLKNDTITRKISGIVRNAIVIDEGRSKSGESYYVKMVAPLYGTGSLAAAVFDDLPKTPEPLPKVTVPSIPQAESVKIQSLKYTGVIIDASGLGLEPCMSPVIYDSNCRAIYGVKNIDADFAVKYGMVGYAKSVAEANIDSRIGDNALLIRAVSVKTGNGINPVNIVITPEDADRILLSNQHTDFLNKAAVIFVR